MSHDLHDYMKQLGAKMDAEYLRIRKSSRHDPGTAGDEGEENWAQLLRDWLPSSYRVVTKGQLLDSQGQLSGQVDVIVLKPSYPPALHAKKKYLLAGVAAAFECKLTLRKRDIGRAFAKMAFIKRMAGKESGTPYRELMTSPICGVLAHSHSCGGSEGRSAEALISEIIDAEDSKEVRHPREMPDLVCVSDLATWVASKEPLADPALEVDPTRRAARDPAGTPSTVYFCHAGDAALLPSKNDEFSSLGVLVTELLVKLAWEDASLRDIAGYFIGVEFSTSAAGRSRSWPRTIFSPTLRRKLSLKRLAQDLGWDECACSIE